MRGSTWDEQKKIKIENCAIWRKEELYWGQRARVKWLNFGDWNTVFHQIVMCRRSFNRIINLKDNNDVWHTEIEDLDGSIQDHFANTLFQS